MTAYAELTGGINISGLPAAINTQLEAMRSLERGSSAPTIKPTGLLWNNTSDPTFGECIQRWDGSAWSTVIDLGNPAISAGGGVAMAADLNLATHKIINLANGSASGDAAACGQVMLLSGANAMSGNMNLGGNRATNAAQATSSTDLARFDQVTPGRTGVARYKDTCTLVTHDAGSDSADFETVDGVAADGGSFCPRLLKIRLSGNYTDQSDGDNHGATTNSAGADVFEWLRWTDGPGHDDYTEIGQVSLSAKTIRVEVKAKRTGPGALGFYLRLRRTDNSERVNVGTVQYMAFSGVNQ